MEEADSIVGELLLKGKIGGVAKVQKASSMGGPLGKCTRPLRDKETTKKKIAAELASAKMSRSLHVE